MGSCVTRFTSDAEDQPAEQVRREAGQLAVEPQQVV